MANHDYLNMKGAESPIHDQSGLLHDHEMVWTCVQSTMVTNAVREGR